MEQLKMIPVLFLMLAISGIIAGAAVLSVGKFGQSMTQCDTAGAAYKTGAGALYNSTIQTNNNGCVNVSNPSLLLGNTTPEYKSTLEVAGGLGVVSEQFGTIGIIAIMVIIIGLISGVFVYFQYFR